ncbi:MAG TPA: hypothetical protein VN436_01885, partial [Holophaga sp.]|nr:hypothetical protein [Holophaga sp.]
NVGSSAIFEAGGQVDKAQREVQAALRAHFRPEFLNRVDEVVTFRALSQEDMAAVARIQLARVEAMLSERRIGLETPPEAMDWLAREGFDPQLGARPLKRLIQQVVVNPLSRMILEARLRPGQMVALKVRDGDLVLEAGAVQ